MSASTLSEVIAGHAARIGDARAFVTESERMTWKGYDARATHLATAFVDAGLAPEERVAVMLPDGPMVHAVYVGAERAGLVVVGIGPRAGRKEIEHLVGKTGAAAFVSTGRHREHDMVQLVADLRAGGHPVRRHLVVGEAGDLAVDGVPTAPERDASAPPARPPIGPEDLFLLNSTSGTTGLPKCVMHTQRRWQYFHELAVDAGELDGDDVFMSVIPAPFGFGIWTAHVTPTLLGAPTVLTSRFSAEATIELIERERVTVLAAVSTQFIMMLGSPALDRHDLSSLRVLFTGGEAVPYDRAARFEDRVGAKVLQFYGSNETGALSRTTTRSSRDERLRTAGRVIDAMQVRLFDDDGADVTATGGPGQPGCRGPATCLGYYNDDAANAMLFTADGWMLTGDIATIDADGCLNVVGRKSDFIIRGGKNVSAPAVEEAALAHPDVKMAAAVAMPSDVYGERVCLYVVLAPSSTLSLDELCARLDADGVSKEMWPEKLVVVDALPMASGGKVAKAELRADARRRAIEDGAATTA